MERAFTRRQPGVDPIALELDRLAEQRALHTLGRGRPTLAAPTAGSTPEQRASFADALDRIRAAWGPEGQADAVLGQMPDDELASHAQMANADIDQYIASGQAYQTPEGDLYTTDANGPDLKPHLAIIHERQNRQIASPTPPTTDQPTIGTEELRQSIGDQMAGMKDALDYEAFRQAFSAR